MNILYMISVIFSILSIYIWNYLVIVISDGMEQFSSQKMTKKNISLEVDDFKFFVFLSHFYVLHKLKWKIFIFVTYRSKLK